MKLKVYGWKDPNKEVWYVSRFPREKNMPKNQYSSQQEAIMFAAERDVQIEWQTNP